MGKKKAPTYLLYELKPLEVDHSAILCLDCGWMRSSFNRHDYCCCPCPNGAMVDGGFDYLRCGAMDMSRIQILKVSPVKGE